MPLKEFWNYICMSQCLVSLYPSCKYVNQAKKERTWDHFLPSCQLGQKKHWKTLCEGGFQSCVRPLTLFSLFFLSLSVVSTCFIPCRWADRWEGKIQGYWWRRGPCLDRIVGLLKLFKKSRLCHHYCTYTLPTTMMLPTPLSSASCCFTLCLTCTAES